MRVVGYGMPRVGNQDFANFVDGNLGGFVTHINNQEDPVPIVPGRFLGFHHASGEIHIQDPGAWGACPGASRLTPLFPSVMLMYGYLLCAFRSRQSFRFMHRRRCVKHFQGKLGRSRWTIRGHYDGLLIQHFFGSRCIVPCALKTEHRGPFYLIT